MIRYLNTLKFNSKRILIKIESIDFNSFYFLALLMIWLSLKQILVLLI